MKLFLYGRQCDVDGGGDECREKRGEHGYKERSASRCRSCDLSLVGLYPGLALISRPVMHVAL